MTRRDQWVLIEDGTMREATSAPLVAYLMRCGHCAEEHVHETGGRNGEPYLTWRFAVNSERKDWEGTMHTLEQDRHDWLMYNTIHQVDVHGCFDTLRALHGRTLEIRREVGAPVVK